MTSITTSASNLYALLIGVDCYLPPKSPGGVSMKNLAGCVRDINHVEAFLKNTLQLSDSNLLKLTASNAPNSSEPAEPKELWPTYENMVAKFQEITEKAQPNDRVYIHYSGHGAQAATIYPQLKGGYALDETLVPTDISRSDARYLRDVELALLMQKMVDKGLIVTLVLDSCHSGGAARNNRQDEGVRGVDMIDMTHRPTDSLVAPMEELIQHWKNSNKNSTQDQDNSRNINSKTWLPEPNGYVLVAACRDNESAYERIFEGNERNGALTYWLLKSLKELGTETSVKVLHNRILAKINTVDRRQTPMLQGEGDRSFFGNNITTLELTASIRQFDGKKNRVELSVGQAHGLRKGSEFAIYRLGTTDLTQTERRIALVKITQLGAVKSWATITQFLGNSKIEDIEAGTPALLLYPNLQLVRKVGLVLPKQHDDQSLGIEPTVAFNAIESAIETGKGWIELASRDEVADYQISINSAGEYEILDRNGIPIANLRPPLKINEPNAAVRLVKRLVHLSKYNSVLALKNHDPMSPLQGKIKVELYPVPDDYESGEPLTSKPFNTVDNLPILEVGESAVLRIKNESFQTLNIAVLVIQPDWTIKHGYPGGAEFHPLRSRGEILWKIDASLPEGCEKGEDVLKMFATVDGTSFDWLELPPLDTAIASKNSQAAKTPLEKFLATFLASEDAPPQRNINSAASASTEWITEQVQLIVKR